MGAPGVEKVVAVEVRLASGSRREGLLSFSGQIPSGDRYEAWRQDRQRDLESGRGSYYCGSPG